MNSEKLHRIRALIWFFSDRVVINGLTAMALESELIPYPWKDDAHGGKSG